jgi:hypothetical protein
MAFKMKGSPMHRNFGVGSPMNKNTDPKKVKQDAKDSTHKGADSDMIMRNQKELDEATKKSDKNLRILENEMDWASDGRNKESEYMKRSGIDSASADYFYSARKQKDLEKTKKQYSKKGSGKPGPFEY